MSAKQDMAPKGGYDFIRYRRNIPNRGPSGAVIVGGIFALSVYGFYKVYQGKRERM